MRIDTFSGIFQVGGIFTFRGSAARGPTCLSYGPLGLSVRPQNYVQSVLVSKNY